MNRLASVRRLIVLGALALLLGAPAVALAGSNPGVLPPNAAPTYPQGEGKAHPYGKTYGQWSAAWQQWTFANPQVFDEDGAHCAAGQAGKAWFLAGNAGGTTVRSCAIPSGTPLFFPILSFGYNLEPTDPCYAEPTDAAKVRCMRDFLAFLMGFVDEGSLRVEIDGTALTDLTRYRVQSPVFSATRPDGTTFPLVVGDGFFIMTTPLPPGEHTIRFASAIPAFGFALDVTYHLTVVPRGQYKKG